MHRALHQFPGRSDSWWAKGLFSVVGMELNIMKSLESFPLNFSGSVNTEAGSTLHWCTFSHKHRHNVLQWPSPSSGLPLD